MNIKVNIDCPVVIGIAHYFVIGNLETLGFFYKGPIFVLRMKRTWEVKVARNSIMAERPKN